MKFCKQDNELVTLSIRDNGIGMKDHQTMDYNTLGMNLIKGFCRDLNADLKIEANNGVEISIKFRREQITH